MPHFSNKGFSPLYLLLTISLTTLVLIATYTYFYINTNNSSENVLQATSPSQTNMNISSFLFQNLFGVQNLNEFNRATTPLIIASSNNINLPNNCIFQPRASKPLNVGYRFNSKQYTASIYQNVPIQVLPKNTSQKRYAVVIIPNTALIGFKNTTNLLKHSCGNNIYILEQPQTPITTGNFINLIAGSGSVTPTATTSPKPPKTAKIYVNTKNEYTFVSVLTTLTTSQNAQTYYLFKDKGIKVFFNDGTSSNYTNFFCSTSCRDFASTINNVTPAISTSGKYITRIEFPKINESTEYEFEYNGKQNCEGTRLPSKTKTFEVGKDYIQFFEPNCGSSSSSR